MENHVDEQGPATPELRSDGNPPTPKTPRTTPPAEEPPAWAMSILSTNAQLQASVDSLKAQVVDLMAAKS